MFVARDEFLYALGVVGVFEGANHLLNVAVHKLGQGVDCKPDSVVGDAALRVVVGSDALGAVARSDLLAAALGVLFVLLFLLELEQSRAQYLKRLGFVFELPYSL